MRTKPDATGSAAVFTVGQRWLLFAATAVLMVLRLPHAWWPGRFEGEEGTVFFAYAWHRPAAEALLRSFGGYLNIAANVITLVTARLVQAGALSLTHAPLVTMATATLFQLAPAALILTGRASWLADRRMVVFSLLVIAMAPMTEEVFANTLHIQFHLTLAVALILVLDTPRSIAARAITASALILGPLCGPGASLLAPFFMLRSVIDRDLRRLGQTILLVAAAALQFLLFFKGSPVRGHLIDPATLTMIMAIRLVALPFLSAILANVFTPVFTSAYLGGGIGWIGSALLSVMVLGGVAVWLWRSGSGATRWLMVSALWIAAVSFGGGMINIAPADWFSTGSAERYNFVPLVLVSIALATAALELTGRRQRIAVALCGLTLLSSAITFPQPIGELAHGPRWDAEVEAWQADHAYELATWPATWSWRVDLSDGTQACHDRSRDADALSDRSYCEGPWIARLTRATAAGIAAQRRITAAAQGK